MLSVSTGRGQVNLNNGLLAYYPFNGNANDVTGNGNNGILKNGPQLTTDRYGTPNSAYYFDGIDDYIVVNDNGKLSPTSVSVAAYVNTESIAFQSIIGKIEDATGFATTYNLGLDYQEQSGFYFGVTQIPGPCTSQYPYQPSYFTHSASYFSTNTWHCLVGTFANGDLRLYVDGVLVDQRAIAYNSLVTCNNTQLLIGNWWSGDQAHFKGKIDEVRIYDRVLNPQEVVALCDVPVSTPLCSGNLGDPIVNIDFGHGGNPGPPLSTAVPSASTTLQYVAVSGNPATPAPQDGQYSITNNVPLLNEWFSGSPDHTPGDVDGYMAFYNGSLDPGEFYHQQVDNLCPGTVYEFSSWIANVLNPAVLVGEMPEITFRIEKTDGTLIDYYNTGPIPQSTAMTWKQFGFTFQLPTGIGSVILKMINNSPGGQVYSGNDLAIDDITFRPCGPQVNASFDANSSVVEKKICQSATDIDLYGTPAAGYATPAYLWQQSIDSGKTWTDLPSSNTLHYTIHVAANSGPLVVNTYRMVTAEAPNLSSSNCRIATNKIYLAIKPIPSGSFRDTSICVGSPTPLHFYAPKIGQPYSIEFTDGTNTYVQSAVDSGDQITGPAIAATTKFTLTKITDAGGCLGNPSAAPATVVVNPLPTGGLKGGTACEGDTTKLYFTATTGRALYTIVVNDGATDYRVDSLKGDGLFSIANRINTGNTTFTLVSITDSASKGCTGKTGFSPSTADLLVNPKPDAVFPDPGLICANDAPVQLAAADQRNLGGTATYSGSGTTNGGIFSPSIGAGTYRVAYRVETQKGCSDTASRQIVVTGLPDASLQGENICRNDLGKLTLVAGEGVSPFSINFSNGSTTLTRGNLSNGQLVDVGQPAGTTSYRLLSVTDATGCTNHAPAENTASIRVSPLPTGGLTGGNVCERDTTRLYFTAASGRAPYTIVLSDGATNYTVNNLAGDGRFSIANRFNTGNSTFTLLSVTDSSNKGCTATSGFDPATASLVVDPAPRTAFGSIDPVCTGDQPVQITSASETSGLPGSGIFLGKGVSSDGLFDPASAGAGDATVVYKFTATDGCADSSHQTISVRSSPAADAGPDFLACPNTPVQLNATGGGDYAWTPSAGLDNASVANPTVTLSESRNYILQVTGADGCTDEDTISITVSKLGKGAFVMANAFSPNDDGINDCFGIPPVWGPVELQEFSIYDRWGERVFHTKDQRVCWNGAFNGLAQPAGGYVFVLKAKTVCGQLNLKGVVMLIR